MNDKSVAKMAITSYGRDAEKRKAIFQALRTSRKYGFPMVNSIADKPVPEQMIWAARFLLSLADSWYQEETPVDDENFRSELFELLQDGTTQLKIDVDWLLGSANGNSKQLKNLYEKANTNAALEIARSYGGTEEQHHLIWVVDQMVRALTGSSYEHWVAETKAGEDGPGSYSWETGIAP